MIVYQAPEDFTNKFYGKHSVFLSGGITGCGDWQRDIIEELGSLHDSGMFDLSSLVIFNPRRDEFDMLDRDMAIEQIKWEHRRLEMCDIFSCFFVDSESVQPITLYELGKYATNKNSVISIVSGYKRTHDVVTQLALDRTYCSVYYEYREAIREHARKIALSYDIIRRKP